MAQSQAQAGSGRSEARDLEGLVFELACIIDGELAGAESIQTRSLHQVIIVKEGQ